MKYKNVNNASNILNSDIVKLCKLGLFHDKEIFQLSNLVSCTEKMMQQKDHAIKQIL